MNNKNRSNLCCIWNPHIWVII